MSILLSATRPLADHTAAAGAFAVVRGGARRRAGRALAAVLARGGSARVRTRVRGHALAHEHARARGGLEDVVDAGGGQRRALLVRARANLCGDALALRARDESGRVRLGRAQVCGRGLAAGRRRQGVRARGDRA
jgi:hypothetical protein